MSAKKIHLRWIPKFYHRWYKRSTDQNVIFRDFPGGSVVKTPQQGAQVGSLVRIPDCPAMQRHPSPQYIYTHTYTHTYKGTDGPLDGKEINPEYSLEGLMLKFQYFGHLMQRADSLEETLMLGKIEGQRRRGWQRIKWLDSITDWRR